MQVIFEQPPWYERWVRSQQRLAAARRTARRLREGRDHAGDALPGSANRRVVRWQFRPSRHTGHLLLLAAVILILPLIARSRSRRLPPSLMLCQSQS